VIVDLAKFIEAERPNWEKLDRWLRQRSDDPWRALTLDEARELERLYLRASADLARLATYSAEPDVRAYLENLVARGYAEVHSERAERGRWRIGRWLVETWPQTFRRHLRPFGFALALMVVGAFFGGLALGLDPESKPILMPFPHLLGDPADRVAQEEARAPDRTGAGSAHSTFAGYLMTHNTRVTLTAAALGVTWGIGTLVILFYNGVLLGAVVLDYVLAGQTVFLLGWLLPHGVVEIPAILVGGQAGFVLAGALLGRGRRQLLWQRLRAVGPDVVTLVAGAAVLLVWAGVVESFLSQYHEPAIPYAVKIAFGVVELAVLVWFLGMVGRRPAVDRPRTGGRS
jgi:uncharacterized membrane protein SpoIIM required for sporulation